MVEIRKNKNRALWWELLTSNFLQIPRFLGFYGLGKSKWGGERRYPPRGKNELLF